MRRTLPLGVALVLAFVAFAIQAVQFPGRALACSCVAPAPALAQLAATEPVTVIAGTIGPAQPDRTAIAVDTWFHGDFATDVVWVSGGTNLVSSCEVTMSPGQRWVLVLWGGPAAPGADGLYGTSLCSPSGMIGTPAGDELLAEAEAVFGAGRTPAPDPDAPAPALDLSPWLGPGSVIGIVALSAGLLLLVVVTVHSRKRSQA